MEDIRLEELDVNDPNKFYHLSEDKRRMLTDWIATNLNRRETFNVKHSSYGLKHKFTGNSENFYIYNGEFKGAMKYMGFDVKDENSINWIFNISQKSPCLK